MTEPGILHRRMLLCLLAACLVAACLLAAPLLLADDNPNRLTETALANALHSGDAKAAIRLFDPQTHSFATVRANIEHLLAAAEVSLSIDATTGLWSVDLTARDTATGTTRRQAKVSLLTKEGVIESFEPADFLAPPHGREAWDLVSDFAAQLQLEQAAPGLAQFDRTMPGVQDLKASIAALWARYQIEPSLDLISNEGDDTHRTLQMDWMLTLRNPQDPVDSSRREQAVTCRVEKQGKAWRIVSFTPVTLFAAPK
jgi:hypothetical protein